MSESSSELNRFGIDDELIALLGSLQVTEKAIFALAIRFKSAHLPDVEINGHSLRRVVRHQSDWSERVNDRGREASVHATTTVEVLGQHCEFRLALASAASGNFGLKSIHDPLYFMLHSLYKRRLTYVFQDALEATPGGTVFVHRPYEI